MSGMDRTTRKQRREVRRRNHVARDLYTPKYGPRIRETKRQHLIDELHEQEIEEELDEFLGKLGIGAKE